MRQLLPDEPVVEAEKKPLLERVGVSYFRSRSEKSAAVTAIDAVHFLNPEERAGMRRVERGAIVRSCVAGALSGAASAVAEVYANTLLPESAGPLSHESLKFWLIVGGVTLVASVLEIAFLYWDTLRSVHELARVAGLELFGKDRSKSDTALGESLARAALELPNPIRGPHGINAQREASKWRLVFASLAYKAKVGVTNFLVKMLVRRMLGRVFVRSVVNTVIPFVAVPITALWNGLVSWRVLHEARVRAMGPSAAEELVDRVFAEAPPLSHAGKLAAVRAVAGAIVRTQDLHPNLVALLDLVAKKVGDLGRAELDDVGELLASLGTLAPEERTVALRLLAIACIVDGRITSREAALFKEALVAAGRKPDLEPIERLRKAFVGGDGVAGDALAGL